MITKIENDADHELAIKELDELWYSEPGTPEFIRLGELAELISAYEDVRWPFDFEIDPNFNPETDL